MRNTRAARRVSGAFFSVSATSGGKTARFGIVVSKKVAAKAVDRNLIKRRFRASLLKHLGVAPAGTYVFVAKRDAAGASFADIRDDIAALISRC
ncbi:MAG: ribonuclease P protein component [Patescibacteria group bacterium]